MRIVYHLGAHCTDEERLVRCLLKNRVVLAEQGISVPSPNRYRKLIRDTAFQLAGKSATAENQALILDRIIEDAKAKRLILSWDSFINFSQWAVRQTLYPEAGDRVHALAKMFSDVEPEFHLAIRNPATFLPELRRKTAANGQRDIQQAVDPTRLRWSDMVQDIVAKTPGLSLTIWCDEETPLIWPEVLQAVSGHSPETTLVDTDEVLAMIMSDIGLARMRSYCEEHPPQSVEQRRKVVTAFLERFARPERVEMDIDLPGWDQAMIDDLTQRYLEDVAIIRQIPGVQLIEA